MLDSDCWALLIPILWRVFSLLCGPGSFKATEVQLNPIQCISDSEILKHLFRFSTSDASDEVVQILKFINFRRFWSSEYERVKMVQLFSLSWDLKGSAFDGGSLKRFSEEVRWRSSLNWIQQIECLDLANWESGLASQETAYWRSNRPKRFHWKSIEVNEKAKESNEITKRKGAFDSLQVPLNENVRWECSMIAECSMGPLHWVQSSLFNEASSELPRPLRRHAKDRKEAALLLS